MIKDINEYLYLIVPNEYRCIYYNILDTLGTLGEDLLASCTATCKGRTITGFACYNMFFAACAAYYLGQVKRARVLISYIKAQLDICCDKTIIFENSTDDEWVLLKVPVQYQCIFEKLMNKMSEWGQQLLDDCTTSCKGNNKNILNAWNLFQAAVISYDSCSEEKADYIMNYIKNLLGFNCPNIEPEYDTPVIKNFVLTYRYNSSGPTIDILTGTVRYDNEQNLVENSLKLVNANTNEVVVDNLPIAGSLSFNIYDYAVAYGANIKFVLKAVDEKGSTISSNEFTVSIPSAPVRVPTLKITSVNYVNNDNTVMLQDLHATCDYPTSFNSDGLTISAKEEGSAYVILKRNITPANSMTVEFEELITYSIPESGLTLTIKLSGTGKDNIVYSDEYRMIIYREPDPIPGPDDPDDPDAPDDPDDPGDNPDDPGGDPGDDPGNDNNGGDDNGGDNNEDPDNPDNPDNPGDDNGEPGEVDG